MAARKKAAKRAKKKAKRRPPGSLMRDRPKDPTSGHPTKIPEENWERFLVLFRQTQNVAASAEACDFSRQSAYDRRERDPEFRRRWDQAYESATDDLEHSTFEKARDGWNEPVFYKGDEVGTVRKFSPTLMMTMLERRRRERYGNKIETTLGAAEAAAAIREALQAMQDVEEGSDASPE